MNIKFSNLGCISETELEMRPLTVIIGPNNANKTYIAYSIYGLYRRIMSFAIHGPRVNFRITQNSQDNWSIKIDKKFCDAWCSHFADYTKTFQRTLQNFFQDSSGKLFLNTEINVSLTATEIIQAIEGINTERNFIFNDRQIAARFNKKSGILELSVIEAKHEKESKKASSIFDEDSPYSIDEYDIKLLLGFELSQRLFGNAFALPAERNALILTYKLLAARRLKLLREAQRRTFDPVKNDGDRQYELLREQGEIGYQQPVEDFLEFLDTVEIQKTKDKVPDVRLPYLALADLVESEIQNKNKTGFKATKLGGREIKIQIKRGLDIDLHNASSSVKQLAPLILYLRYRATPQDLLLIDEPEMNLHPEAQVKLLEILAMLVNKGIKVILTTHSPYFLAHLNNLMIGEMGDSTALKRQSTHLYLKNPEAFLSSEKVSAYQIKDKKLQSLYDPEYGIRWDTLSDVAGDIQERFFRIYKMRKADS